jgi:hypothetical protein
MQIRWRLPRLPEAAGPRQGWARVDGVPADARLGLLIVGASSAAGVGVDLQDDALAGRLSQALARRLGLAVRWQFCARSGVTTGQAARWLADAVPADVAVVVTGVNDVVSQVRPAKALAARADLIAVLRQRTGVRHVVLAPVPPMQRFSSLPQPLRWLAGRAAVAHERALAGWAALQAGSAICPSTCHCTIRRCWRGRACIPARRSTGCGARPWPSISPPPFGPGSEHRAARRRSANPRLSRSFSPWAPAWACLGCRSPHRSDWPRSP